MKKNFNFVKSIFFFGLILSSLFLPSRYLSKHFVEHKEQSQKNTRTPNSTTDEAPKVQLEFGADKPYVFKTATLFESLDDITNSNIALVPEISAIKDYALKFARGEIRPIENNNSNRPNSSSVAAHSSSGSPNPVPKQIQFKNEEDFYNCISRNMRSEFAALVSINLRRSAEATAALCAAFGSMQPLPGSSFSYQSRRFATGSLNGTNEVVRVYGDAALRLQGLVSEIEKVQVDDFHYEGCTMSSNFSNCIQFKVYNSCFQNKMGEVNLQNFIDRQTQQKKENLIQKYQNKLSQIQLVNGNNLLKQLKNDEYKNLDLFSCYHCPVGTRFIQTVGCVDFRGCEFANQRWSADLKKCVDISSSCIIPNLQEFEIVSEFLRGIIEKDKNIQTEINANLGSFLYELFKAENLRNTPTGDLVRIKNKINRDIAEIKYLSSKDESSCTDRDQNRIKEVELSLKNNVTSLFILQNEKFEMNGKLCDSCLAGLILQ